MSIRLPRVVYIVQYEYVWSLTIANAITLAQLGKNGRDYNLGKLGKPLKRRGRGKGWPSNEPLCFHTLDNAKSDWVDMEEQLTALLHETVR